MQTCPKLRYLGRVSRHLKSSGRLGLLPIAHTAGCGSGVTDGKRSLSASSSTSKSTAAFYSPTPFSNYASVSCYSTGSDTRSPRSTRSISSAYSSRSKDDNSQQSTKFQQHDTARFSSTQAGGQFEVNQKRSLGYSTTNYDGQFLPPSARSFTDYSDR